MAEALNSKALERPPLESPTSSVRRPRILGLHLTDGLLVGAVIGVVCLVSMPRLADYVRRTNQEDARTALALLGPTCTAAPEEIRTGLLDFSSWSPRLRHRLQDARPLASGPGLLYHGYIFTLRPSRDGTLWLLARPRSPGRTGEGIFAWSPQRGPLQLRSAAASKGGSEGFGSGSAGSARMGSVRGGSEIGESEGLLDPELWIELEPRRPFTPMLPSSPSGKESSSPGLLEQR